MEIRSSKEKLKLLDELLSQDHLLIHLNTSWPGVVIPDRFTKDAVLTLKISRLFQGRMELNEEKIQAQLLFDNQYFDCQIPLAAIWGCTSADTKNFLWPESLNPEALSQMSGKVIKNNRAAEPELSKPAKPMLKRIK